MPKHSDARKNPRSGQTTGRKNSSSDQTTARRSAPSDQSSARKSVPSGGGRKSAAEEARDALSVIKNYLPAGSRERTVAKIAAAAGGALIAAALLGVGPVALAGAAGYLVYRETHR